jgi:DNA-binding NarL/FixJ family response regulator
VAISNQNHPQRIRDVIAAGAHSYVHKAKDGAELCQAIRAAAAHEPYISRAHAAAIHATSDGTA